MASLLSHVWKDIMRERERGGGRGAGKAGGGKLREDKVMGG